MSTADPSVLARLTFIKGLYRVARDLAARRDALRAAGLLLLHDAMELWLRLAGEKLKIGEDRTPFVRYWKLAREEGVDLPLEQAMARFNTARVGLKHAGLMPAASDVNTFATLVGEFLDEATARVFETTFAELSLIDALPECETKALLQAAHDSLRESDQREAINATAKAFYSLSGRLLQPSVLVRDRRIYFRDYAGDFGGGRGDFLRQAALLVDNKLQPLHERVAMLTLGIDLPRYLRFRTFMPLVQRMSDGQYRIVRTGGHPALEADFAEARECVDFVTDVALQVLNVGEEPAGDPELHAP